MIVPSVQLVLQGYNDMKEYKEFFQTETVWAKGEYCECANLTIGTFQSLVKRVDKKNKKFDPKFFDKFDVVLCDEVHTAKCKSIDTLLSQPFMRDVKLRFGFSGTLPDKATIESYTVQSLMGPQIQDIRSKELMDAGYITPIDITQVRIHHKYDTRLLDQYIEYGEYLCSNYVTEINDKGQKVRVKRDVQDFTMKDKKELPVVLREMKKQVVCGEKTKNDYYNVIIEMCKAQGSNLLNLEQMILHHSQDRVEVIDNILRGIDKNTIVFAHHTEYLKHLHKHFTEQFPDRPVYLITGQTTPKKRTQIVESMLTDKGAILVASYGCVGTGITLKNIDYGIFAQSFKSKIIVLQSLGRGLCLAEGKDRFYLYDVVDCLPTGRLEGQGREHCKIFKKQNFNYKIVDVNL
jgi:superfamily II DNA or RNA helicase